MSSPVQVPPSARRLRLSSTLEPGAPEPAPAPARADAPLCGPAPGGARRPKISVLTPSFNCARFLREAIESVVRQRYDNFEHIVADGASTDGTLDILRSYPHVRWLSEKDGGEAEALNKALRMATGDILVWFNADDVFQPGVFDQVAELLAPAAGRHVVYGKALVIDEEGDVWGARVPTVPLTLSRLLRSFQHLHVYQPAMFFSRALIDAVGPFREDLYFSIDLEFWLRIAAKGYAFHYIDQPLARTRLIRSGAKSSASWIDQEKSWMEIGCSYVHLLTPPEQVGYWKDYYLFRVRAQAAYGEPLLLPGERNALHGFALALQELGASDELLSVLEHGLKLHPEAPELHFMLAELVRRAGRVDSARRIADTALRLEARGGGRYYAPSAIEMTAAPRSVDLSANVPASRPVPGPEPARRALVFFPHNVFPPRSGAHRRAVATLSALRLLGYRTTLLGSTQFTDTPWVRQTLPDVERLQEIELRLHDASPADVAHVQRKSTAGSPLSSGLHAVPGLRRLFAEAQRELGADLVIVNYAYWARLVDDPAFAGAVRLIDTHDLLWLNARFRERLAALPPPPYHPDRVPAGLLDESLFRAIADAPGPEAAVEHELYERFQGTLVIAPNEAELLRPVLRRTRVAYLPMSVATPAANDRRSTTPLLVAHDNPLNAHGYLFFAGRVLPEILRRVPGFELQLAGALSGLVAPLRGVRPLGYVDDLDALYRQSGFAICPVLDMTGQPVKVIEAMAHGLPVVLFEPVARRVPIEHGRTGFVARTASDFAEHCARLASDPGLCRTMGEAAREVARHHCSLDTMARRLDELVTQIRHPPR